MKTLLVTAAVAAVVSLSSLMLGCSGAPSGSGESSAADLSADSTETADATKSALVGTFTAVGTNPLDLRYTTYTFKSDGTFTAIGGCGESNCHSITEANGTWTSKSATLESTSQKEVTLVDSLGNKDTYIYTVSGNTMTFNVTLDGATQFFYNASWKKSIPMGDVCEDANGKSLGECSDSGNFGCGGSGVSDDVSTCNPLD
jgi:hypothetical protein